MTHKETQEFTKEVLNHMRERLSDYQEQYGDLYNLEATPAESTTYRLAKHDIRRYPEIITASDKMKNETPYYTNSSHLPVGYTDDIFAALDIQDGLQTLYTSGTVFHAFLGEKLPSWKSAATLIRTIAENYKLPYYTLSPTYSVCKNHGYISGEVYECPHCGEKTEVYSRITGYYRPVQNWNDGKTQEYKDRVVYNREKFGSKQPIYGEMPFKMDDEPAAAAEAAPTAEAPAQAAQKCILFTTATCPKCRMAKMFLDNAGIEYETVIAEENVELTNLYGIKEAPTLVVINGTTAQRVANPSNIKAFCEQLVKA